MAKSYNQSTEIHPRIAEKTRNDQQGLLASERCYLIAQSMVGRTAPVELGELAEIIALRESGLDASDEDTIHRIEASLHHRHLPRMDEVDALDYDPEANRINP